MKYSISFVLAISILCFLVANIVEASYMYRAMSSLEVGTPCHAYITDCKDKTLFDN
ncbi:8321_t:CDS:2, partial [Funneliformis caledonium]